MPVPEETRPVDTYVARHVTRQIANAAESGTPLIEAARPLEAMRRACSALA